jgi:predicted MFS family arabinose efflux permease
MSSRLYKPLLGGVLALAVAMGIGRFAYTPMLPVMEKELGLSVSMAGALASLNYIGYFIGALVAAWLPLKRDRSRIQVIAFCLLLSALTTGAMAIFDSYWAWSILRGLSGVCSAIILVVCSSFIMDWLSRRREQAKIGIFYSGVGLGIAVTGIAVPLLDHLGNWRTGWYGLGLVSLIAGVCSFVLLSGIVKDRHELHPQESSPVKGHSPFALWGITLAYGLEGLGYIVMGTFVNVYFAEISTISWLGNTSWTLVGLAALPSTLLWTAAAQKWSLRRAAYLAYLAQAVGVILPTLVPGVASALIGSLLFGGTFMGITTLALTIGKQASRGQSARTIGNMTAAFSIGQIIGPIAAAGITDYTGSYSLSMFLSGILLLTAMVFLRISEYKDNHN